MRLCVSAKKNPFLFYFKMGYFEEALKYLTERILFHFLCEEAKRLTQETVRSRATVSIMKKIQMSFQVRH